MQDVFSGLVPGEVAAGVCDLVEAGQPDQGDREVAYRREDVRAAGGSLVAVFAESHVTDVVMCLDLPLPTDQGGQFGGGGLGGGQAGDAQDPGDDRAVGLLLRPGQSAGSAGLGKAPG